jgi:hypothetical protein
MPPAHVWFFGGRPLYVTQLNHGSILLAHPVNNPFFKIHPNYFVYKFVFVVTNTNILLLGGTL